MTPTIDQLVILVSQILTQVTAGAYPTDADGRVYAPRDWPTHDGQYPAIFLSGPRERKQSLGNAGASQFRVTGTLRIAARDSAAAASDDGSAGPLLASLGSLKRQIEAALIDNPLLMSELEQIGDVSSELAFKNAGEKHLGEVEIMLELVYYQGPEDFFQIKGVPLTDVQLQTPFPTPLGPPVGFDLNMNP